MTIYNQIMQQELTAKQVIVLPMEKSAELYICKWARDVTTDDWEQRLRVQQCKRITYLSPI